MSNAEYTYTRTRRTEAVLNLFRAFKRYQELVKSGVDSDTAFLQAILGVYYAVPPVPRPDYVMTVSDLYGATKEAHAYVTQLKDEAEAAMAFLKDLMKHEK